MDQVLEKNCQGTSWCYEDQETLQARVQELLRTAAGELQERFDQEKGCFEGLSGEQENRALLFLLEYARRAGDRWAGALAEAALERRSGPCDALLAYAHLEAYAQTGQPGCRKAARSMLDYALKELRLPGGCFISAGDESVSAAWNAQMIAALAKAYRVLGEETYLQAAVKARLFLKTWLTQSSGRLWRRLRGQTPMEEGRLADYGLYCWALLELYESDYAITCLREAEELADRMAEIFRDQQGGFYDFDAGAPGSGAAGLALSKLARLTAIDRYREMAREQMSWLAGAGSEFLDGLGLLGMVEELWPRQELVCASAGKLPAWLALVGEEYRLAVLAKTNDNSWGLENAVPYLREFPVPESGDQLYLCRDGVCEASAEGLFQLYRRLSPEETAV